MVSNFRAILNLTSARFLSLIGWFIACDSCEDGNAENRPCDFQAAKS